MLNIGRSNCIPFVMVEMQPKILLNWQQLPGEPACSGGRVMLVDYNPGSTAKCELQWGFSSWEDKQNIGRSQRKGDCKKKHSFIMEVNIKYSTDRPPVATRGTIMAVLSLVWCEQMKRSWMRATRRDTANLPLFLHQPFVVKCFFEPEPCLKEQTTVTIALQSLCTSSWSVCKHEPKRDCWSTTPFE